MTQRASSASTWSYSAERRGRIYLDGSGTPICAPSPCADKANQSTLLYYTVYTSLTYTLGRRCIYITVKVMPVSLHSLFWRLYCSTLGACTAAMPKRIHDRVFYCSSFTPTHDLYMGAVLFPDRSLFASTRFVGE
jgi:hypothetical protein